MSVRSNNIIPDGFLSSKTFEIRGFIAGRHAQEAANIFNGLAGGVWLLRSVDSFDISPAFHDLLLIANENFWACLLFAWGTIMALAWFCGPLRCRAWGMLFSFMLWCFLTLISGLSSNWISILVVLCASQALGSLISYFRLAGQVNAGN